MDMKAFFELHCGIPREGPGSDEATRTALGYLPLLPPRARIFDLGCGPGKQTLVLARELRTPIIAVDFHEPFIEVLKESAEKEGLSDLIEARVGDMGDLKEPEGSIDLIWAEGSIFVLGFGEGLELWRPLLKPQGLVAATELTWTTDDRRQYVVDFFAREYPAMCNVDENLEIARSKGYKILKHFSLDPSVWWDEYLTPLDERARRLRSRAAEEPELARVLADHDREIDVCRRFQDHFAYVFYILQRTD